MKVVMNKFQIQISLPWGLFCVESGCKLVPSPGIARSEDSVDEIPYRVLLDLFGAVRLVIFDSFVGG